MKTIINNIEIQAISSWLPKNALDLRSFDKLYGISEVNNIIKTTGIESVRIADEFTTSSDMCYNAAESLLINEEINRDEIDGLVFVSQTSDWILPATSISLQNRLGLSKDTLCIDIHYGCSGYVYGLLQAASWIKIGACKKVLVLSGDTTSRLINQNDKSLKMVFGDCGTASIITEGNNFLAFNIQSDGSGYDRLIVPAGGFRFPRTNETSVIEWDEDKNGRTKEDLYMDGMAIFQFAITNVHKNIDKLLELIQWNKEDVGLFALHQANLFMVNYIAKKIKVDISLVPTNVKNFGNVGPATIPLLLSDICSKHHNYNLSKVIMSGFGVGLSWGSVAANLSNTKFYKPINE